MNNRIRHLGQLAQRRDREQVRRHQEWKDARIVRGAESGSNQSNRLHRVSKSVFAQCLGGRGRGALKVVRAESILSLLLAHGADYDTHGIAPLRIEWLRSAGLLPV